MNLTTHVVAGALVLNLGFGYKRARNPQTLHRRRGLPRRRQKHRRFRVTITTTKLARKTCCASTFGKRAEISRTTPVRPDGKISLPLLDDVQAAGLTPVQLAGVIAEGLKKYITNPQVTVGVAEINSRRIYVTGEVTRPGAFPLLPDMTILQALSTSGGFTQFARLKSIYVLRTVDGKQVKHPFDYKAAVAGKKAEQNLLLQPGDVIVVP